MFQRIAKTLFVLFVAGMLTCPLSGCGGDDAVPETPPADPDGTSVDP